MSPKVIAYYLPQFHPIPENDEWWGKGFTEWTNVGKASPLFKGHYQPHVPADLGYYDLRVPETRKEQADLAAKYGIYGFCYWHYWFGNGKRLLERPFNEVVESGEPDFPFCLAWANESWKGFYHGVGGRNLLIEQLYPGVADYTEHFYTVLPALKDKRYIKINNKPLFIIYNPLQGQEIKDFIEIWRKLALHNGLDGIYFVGLLTWADSENINSAYEAGVDAINTVRMHDYKLYSFPKTNICKRIKRKIHNSKYEAKNVYEYEYVSQYFLSDKDKEDTIFPTIISGWDHSPRTGKEGLIFHNYNPSVFKKHVCQTFDLIKDKNHENQIVFLKSWNEWAEGNYMEPDLKYGHQFLEVFKECLDNAKD